MNPLYKITAYYSELTATDKELALYFAANPHDVVTKNTEIIAREAKTSKAAISRFCKKIGFSGYSEFRYELSRFLVSRNDQVENEEEKDPITAITDLYSDYIRDIKNYVTSDQFNALASDFLACPKVKIMGMNRSFNSACQLRQRLLRMGYDNSEAVGDRDSMNDIFNLMDNDYLLIIFTTTDNMRVYSPVLSGLDKNGGKLAVITINRNLPFRKNCDHFIVLPRISKDSNMSFLDDQALFLVFIEILLNFIAKNHNMEH
ncbi:MAG: MurR/RpiR family transcriptional regulator [Erysipelotrichaceae bacterium]|nr:MurR/RpiR family transcriptional regulator [Erysipelotrichaceae bacterium]